jgi:hypothetical protein
MTLGKIKWLSNSRLLWEITDVGPGGGENKREIVIRRSKKWYLKLDVISREEVIRLEQSWGSVVSQEIEIPMAGPIVLVVRYYDGPAHIVEGPYRIVEEKT